MALSGRLLVGVTPLVASYVYSDLLARFRRAFPNIAVEAVEDAADYLEHLLVGGELDVAVIVLPPGRRPLALHTEPVEVSPCRSHWEDEHLGADRAENCIVRSRQRCGNWDGPSPQRRDGGCARGRHASRQRPSRTTATR